MPDSWDSEEGQTHSVGDGCTPPHTLPTSELVRHYAVDVEYRLVRAACRWTAYSAAEALDRLTERKGFVTCKRCLQTEDFEYGH